MVTLTVQIKSLSKGWVDGTIVVVFDHTLLESELALLLSELPVGFAARIKINTNGKITYKW